LIAERLGFPADAAFVEGQIEAGGKTASLADATAAGELTAEGEITFGDLAKKYQLSTFGAHFVEVAVDLDGGSACAADAGGLLRRADSQSEDRPQSGDWRDDDGRRRGAV
jgi:CO/xanthine dehydrogenase Mo-binding subunit